MTRSNTVSRCVGNGSENLPAGHAVVLFPAVVGATKPGSQALDLIWPTVKVVGSHELSIVRFIETGKPLLALWI